LLTIAQPYANHNGGAVRFGPDGYLYIGWAMAARVTIRRIMPGPHQPAGQNAAHRREYHDRPASYGIPPDNPFAGSPQPGVRSEIWAYGLRNPWRFSFDSVGGDLFIGDVGQGAREEIDFVRAGARRNKLRLAGDGGHAVYRISGGWAAMQRSGFTPPIVDYDHGQGCSVTGGYVVPGPRGA